MGYKKIITFFTAVIFVTLGVYLGFLLDENWKEQKSRSFAAITIAGAFGGLLYTARNNGIEFPHFDPEKEHQFNLGFVADCAYGVAGGYVVFLVLPTGIEVENPASKTDLLSSIGLLQYLKMISLAIVGGYGGRSLIDNAAVSIAKQAQAEAQKANQNATAVKKDMADTREADAKALEIVNEHLDPSEKPQDPSAVKKAVMAASQPVRIQIFKDARKIRSSSWKDQKELMERTIPIFEGLIANNANEQYHRNHAQLAYALKDCDEPVKDVPRAYDELTQAIKMRDDAGDEGFLMYEFNRAICGIALDKDEEEILHDLRLAAKRETLKTVIELEAPFVKWFKAHGIDPKTLKKK